MQTEYEVSSLSVPVISRINEKAGYIRVATPFLYVQGVALPFFLQWQGVALHLFSEA